MFLDKSVNFFLLPEIFSTVNVATDFLTVTDTSSDQSEAESEDRVDPLNFEKNFLEFNRLTLQDFTSIFLMEVEQKQSREL